MSTRQIKANIHLWNMRILIYNSFITMWYYWLGKNIQRTILKTNMKTFKAASAPAPFTYYSDLCRDLCPCWLWELGKCCRTVYLRLTFYPHFLYTLDTLQVHSSSIWVSTALATFACKRKPLTVYLPHVFIFPFMPGCITISLFSPGSSLDYRSSPKAMCN